MPGKHGDPAWIGSKREINWCLKVRKNRCPCEPVCALVLKGSSILKHQFEAQLWEAKWFKQGIVPDIAPKYPGQRHGSRPEAAKIFASRALRNRVPTHDATTHYMILINMYIAVG